MNGYVSYVSKKLKRPKSIKKFAKHLDVKKKDIVKHFDSFDDIEAGIYVHFMQKTESLLAQEEFLNHHEALLALYFTFFEHLTANKTYVHTIIKAHNKDFRKLKTLYPIKKALIKCIDNYAIRNPVYLPEFLSGLKGKAKHEAIWAHFMFVFAFWIKDRSDNKEKTDALIEKSLRVAKDLEHSKLFESAMDLGKFMFKEIKSRA